MDLASLLGFLLAIVFMALAVIMGGGGVGAFIDIPSIIVTVGGSLATVLCSLPLRSTLQGLKAAKVVFLNKTASIPDLVEEIVSLAETSRHDGLLALESRAADIRHPFLALGIQLTVDGTNPEVLENVLRTEMEALNERHKEGKLFFDQWGKTGPSFGMIGTLLGLIIMLGNLSDPEKLGPGMAVALITTLYGALLANVVCIPFAEKLNQVNRQELAAMEVIIRGVLAIQAGDSPRVVHQKLSVFIPPKARTQPNKSKAA